MNLLSCDSAWSVCHWPKRSLAAILVDAYSSFEMEDVVFRMYSECRHDGVIKFLKFPNGGGGGDRYG
jgi:hypothetical protein